MAFPPDFVEKIETYLLGSSHINMMEISGKKVGRGWRSFDLDYLNKEELEHSVIYLDFPHVDGIRVYEPVEGEDLHREIPPSRNILKTYYQLSHDFDSSRSIFIYIEDPEAGMEINFSDYDDFFRIQNLEIIFIAVVLGFVLAFALINLVLYASTGDSIYVWHAIYVSVMMTTLYCYSGMRFFLTGVNINSMLMQFMMLLTALLSLNFTYRYLTFRQKSIIMEKVYTFIAFFFVIFSIVMFVSMDREVSAAFEMYLMLAYLLIIVSAVVFYYKYDHISIYYLAGTLLLEFGSIINSASVIGWIDRTIIIRVFFYLSIGLEGLLFTMGIIETVKTQKQVHEELEVRVVTDVLTGLKNRYYCDVHVKNEFFGSEATDRIISMLIIDIDHFKNVNDTYGHDIGDKILSEVSEILASSVRSTDVVMRWGGEEFAILLPEVRLFDAITIANKINRKVQANTFSTVNRLTVSIGVAQKQKGESFESLYKRADTALYSAKEHGRNTVMSSRGVSEKRIPIALAWSDELECGNELIDMQHEKMHFLMNDLLIYYFEHGMDMGFEKLFNESMDFIEQHFSDEENLLGDIGYPMLAEHSRMHAELIDRTDELRKKVKAKTMNESDLVSYVVTEVVFGHLVNEDRDFYKYVNKRE